MNHDSEFQIGVINSAWIEEGKLKVKVKFSSSSRVKSILKDIIDGIRTCTSIGYDILDYSIKVINGRNTMVVKKWMPYEASSVSIPADYTVGFMRNKAEQITETIDEEKNEMDLIEKPVEETSSENITEAEVTETIEETVESPIQEEIVQEEIVEETMEESYDDADEITTLGKITGEEILASEFVEAKKSLKEFKDYLKNKTTNNVIKENKMKKFSLRKALAMNTSRFNGEIENTDEYAIIADNKRKYNNVDADVIVTRSQLRSIDGSEAINQVNYRPDLYTEALYPLSVLARTGATRVDVEGPSISFGVCVSGLNAGFVDVNGDLPSGTAEWALKTMTPKKCGAYVQLDYKALLQDSPEIEGIIQTDIIKALDTAIDVAAIAGTGSNNQPTGILNNADVNIITTDDVYTLSAVYNFEKAIRNSNDYAETLTWVMNTNDYYKFATTPYSAIEQNNMLLDVDTRKLIGHNVVICNALNDGQIILGNFNELLIADFDAISLKVVEDAALSRKQAVEVQAFAAVDMLCRRPKSFSIKK